MLVDRNRLPLFNDQQMISPITQIHIKHVRRSPARTSIPRRARREVTEMQQPELMRGQLSAKLASRGVYFRSSGSKTRRAPSSIGRKYPALKRRVGGSSPSCSSDIGLTPPAASCVFPEARTKLARRKTNDVEGTTLLGNCGAVDAARGQDEGASR